MAERWLRDPVLHVEPDNVSLASNPFRLTRQSGLQRDENGAQIVSFGLFPLQNKLLDLERKDQENKLAQKYIDKLCEEDLEKERRRREGQRQLREDLNAANQTQLERRELEKQQDVLVDLKVCVRYRVLLWTECGRFLSVTRLRT